MNYGDFIFDRYDYDAQRATLILRYRYAKGPSFEEHIHFEGKTRPLEIAHEKVLDRLFRLVFLLSGVSYYKAFIPRTLLCEAFPLDARTAAFVERVYVNGLAEFAFRNGISLRNNVNLRSEPGPEPTGLPIRLPRRTCVPVGGGKDSIVTLECLKQSGEPLALFALGDAAPIAATIRIAGVPFVRVRRRLDEQLFALNEAGALNGHVPITAIVSTIALCCAVLYGFDTIAMSNEHSSSAPNFQIDGASVNHQYSKSLEFEEDLSSYLKDCVSQNIRFFSFLRPLSEIAIARRFSRHTNYFPIFRSCNSAFRQDADARSKNWCCNCPKCRFVFLALAPFVPKADLIAIFGSNLLDDVAQIPGYEELCGITAFKPFECVGETEESAALVSHLRDDPKWASDKVVRALKTSVHASHDDLVGLGTSFLGPSDRHRVPERFLKILYACG